MFRHRQQLRRWAALLLFVWLCGLGATVANACLATEQAALTEQAEPLAQPPAAPLHVHDDAHAQHGTVAKSNCQDFCSKVTLSIPPLKPSFDDVAPHAVLAMPVAFSLPVPARAPLPPWVAHQHGALDPPIPIAFLRLTR
ncbi:MAG: hypothetical protein HY855_15550 [Burkholderiales bacterium]|nr:hypothetical protein [Burkholderiales bacterium]